MLKLIFLVNKERSKKEILEINILFFKLGLLLFSNVKLW